MPELDVAELDPFNSRGDAILITDASAEGERIASALRARDFFVIDVPLSLLEARAIGESPRVILVDVDQPGALEAVERLRELAVGCAAELICLGDRTRSAELGIPSHRTFERPVDVERLLATITPLAEPIRRDGRVRGTTPPPSYSPRRETSPPARRESEMPSPPSEYPAPNDALDVEALLPSLDDTSMPAKLLPTELSPELEQLLFAAEARVSAVEQPVSGQGGEEEVDLLLPADLLAALDEPLDPEEDEGGTGSGLGGGTPAAKPTTAANKLGTAGGATVAGTGLGTSPGSLGPLVQPAAAGTGAQSVVARTNVMDSPREFGFERTPVPLDRANVPPMSVSSRAPTNVAPVPSFRARDEPPSTEFELQRALSQSAPSSQPAPESWRGPKARAGEAEIRERVSELEPRIVSAPPGSRGTFSYGLDGPTNSEPLVPAVLGEGDALRALARAISGRASGSLALGAETALRRIVLREGDVVTAGSGVPEETLLAFLVSRGDLEREVAQQLAGKLPPFGRHAGAALIAHGHLGQDDLWPVLRAHAEWIIGIAAMTDVGTCELEQEPPGRLKAEPNVFGGATGAEVLVETARRVFAPDLALRRLGGPNTRLEEGPRLTLLTECALRREEEEIIRAARGRTAGEFLASADPELANVLYVLVALDVFEAIVPVAPARQKAAAADDPLDEEAVRKRIRARVALVEDGDYFALLGIARSATGYEIRRAYLELRRQFEPRRMLTAALADLSEDVRLVVEVLEEAYEILREPHRRERYRRAIEAGPP